MLDASAIEIITGRIAPTMNFALDDTDIPVQS
jgi:hypothetical protein